MDRSQLAIRRVAQGTLGVSCGLAFLATLITPAGAAARDVPTAECADPQWEQTVDTDAAFAGVHDDARLVAGGRTRIVLPGLTLPPGEVTVADLGLWTGWDGRGTTTPSPAESVRVELFQAGALVGASEPSPDLTDGTDSAGWHGGLGAISLPSGADRVELVLATEFAPIAGVASISPVALCLDVAPSGRETAEISIDCASGSVSATVPALGSYGFTTDGQLKTANSSPGTPVKVAALDGNAHHIVVSDSAERVLWEGDVLADVCHAAPQVEVALDCRATAPAADVSAWDDGRDAELAVDNGAGPTRLSVSTDGPATVRVVLDDPTTRLVVRSADGGALIDTTVVNPCHSNDPLDVSIVRDCAAGIVTSTFENTTPAASIVGISVDGASAETVTMRAGDIVRRSFTSNIGGLGVIADGEPVLQQPFETCLIGAGVLGEAELPHTGPFTRMALMVIAALLAVCGGLVLLDLRRRPA